MKHLLVLIIPLLVLMCNSNKPVLQSSNMQAPLIVYKTEKDYSNNIPIILNDSKNKIVSYPAISDIYINGKFAKPNNLANGFLLDNIGLSVNSVYTSYTYEAYSKLDKVPTIQQFMDSIIDNNPFSDMYKCGNRTKFKTIGDINFIIKNNFENYTKIK